MDEEWKELLDQLKDDMLLAAEETAQRKLRDQAALSVFQAAAKRSGGYPDRDDIDRAYKLADHLLEVRNG